MLSMHWAMSLIHDCLSCTVDATSRIEWRLPDFVSIMILKSRDPFVFDAEFVVVAEVVAASLLSVFRWLACSDD